MDNQNGQNSDGSNNQGYTGQPNQNYNQGYTSRPNQNYNQGYTGQPNQNYNQGYNGRPNQNYNQGYNGQSNQNYNQSYTGQPNQNYNQGYNGQPNQGYNQGYTGNYNQGYNPNFNNMNYNMGYGGPVPDEFRQEKNIAVCIILSFVTCSIYMWFWMYSVVKKIRMLNGDQSDMVGEYLLLMLVPYYNVYWVYTRGKAISEAAARRGIQIADNSVVYLILNILGLSIVSYAMIQNDLNKLARML